MLVRGWLTTSWLVTYSIAFVRFTFLWRLIIDGLKYLFYFNLCSGFNLIQKSLFRQFIIRILVLFYLFIVWIWIASHKRFYFLTDSIFFGFLSLFLIRAWIILVDYNILWYMNLLWFFLILIIQLLREIDFDCFLFILYWWFFCFRLRISFDANTRTFTSFCKNGFFSIFLVATLGD